MSDTLARHILGLPEMDEQHRYLYRLFDMLGSGPKVVDGKRMGSLLDELDRYIHFHFTSEEHLMRGYAFKDFGAHQSDHEAAANRFLRFAEDFNHDRLSPGALRIFLTGWLMEHSRTADAEYAAWILKCRRDVGIVQG